MQRRGAKLCAWVLMLSSIAALQMPMITQAATKLTLPAPITWATYYGEGQVDVLKQYQLVNLEGQNYSAAEIAAIKSGGTKVISYLNVGACEIDGEDARSYAAACQPYKLESYHGFPGEFWMDVSNAGWRSVVLDTIAPPLAAKGIDGFFFDNLDVVDLRENRPDIHAGLVALVQELRAKYPSMIFVANNGFTVINELLPSIDALTKEDVFSTYDFDTNTYKDQEVAVTNEIVARLSQLKQQGLPILTIDFQINAAKVQEYRQRTIDFGFS
ncbi:MAG: endo alpha-1,4 polygalactosaminidase, partial [Patescibacteria group bacterium]